MSCGKCEAASISDLLLDVIDFLLLCYFYTHSKGCHSLTIHFLLNMSLKLPLVLCVFSCFAKNIKLSLLHVWKQLHLTPNEINAPMTLPAIVANPPVITTWISDLVMSFKYGRTSRGASLWHTNKHIANVNNNNKKTIIVGFFCYLNLLIIDFGPHKCKYKSFQSYLSFKSKMFSDYCQRHEALSRVPAQQIYCLQHSRSLWERFPSLSA